MNYQDKKNMYIGQGYKPTEINHSGLGTEVLFKDNKVVRLGVDPAYDHYAKLIINNSLKSKNAPIIFKHELPLGEFTVSGGIQYSCTEMELLEELDSDEAIQYKDWIEKEVSNLGTGKPASSDPFNLEIITRALIEYAANNNLGLDLTQAKNVMKRGSTYVHLGPFGQWTT
jgi:hypothetical protein